MNAGPGSAPLQQGGKALQILRYADEDVEADGQIGQAHGQEELRNAEAGGAEQQAGAQGAGDHEQGVEDVVGGDDAGAVSGCERSWISAYMGTL